MCQFLFQKVKINVKVIVETALILADDTDTITIRRVVYADFIAVIVSVNQKQPAENRWFMLLGSRRLN